MAESPLAQLYLEEAHAEDHGGLDRMVLRARKRVWIIQARRIAKHIKNNCYRCRLLYKKCMEQKMGPLPPHRVGPEPVFTSTAVDLFGPLMIRDAVKRRTSSKTWGVVFTCTRTSAVCLELVESYSTDHFLHALDRFTAHHGMPDRFQSDAGDQLAAAGKIVGTYDFSKILDWTREKATEWVVLPTGAQHFNGQAERMVGIAKNCLEQILGSINVTFGELQTALKKAQLMMNSRPLAMQPGSDPDVLSPITPLHLIGGRASIHVPEANFEVKPSLTRRMQYLEQIRREFWEKWLHLMFGQLIPAKKWRKDHPDLKVDDVVLMKDESIASRTYRLARVKQVFIGNDGHVRRALLVYKNPGESVFRETERPIHKLVLIVQDS